MNVFIYVIKHPKTKQIVYVGQTGNFKNRIRMHVTSTKTKSPIGTWISILKVQNLSPIFEIVHECKYEDRLKMESELINAYKAQGCFLLNYHVNAIGGRQNYIEAEKRYLTPYIKLLKQSA